MGTSAKVLVVWAVNALALLALPYIIPGVQVVGFGAALVGALVLGLLNALVRPILVLLTLPITLLTLGLFILVINALLFWFAASFLEGFQVTGFWTAFFGAIVYSIISWAATSALFGRAE